MKKLFSCKMHEGGFSSSHLNDFWSIVNQLKSVDIPFDDEVKALLLLCSFPNSQDNLVMDVSNTLSANNIFKFDYVVSIILNEEIHRKSTQESSFGNDLYVEKRGRQKQRFKSKNNGKSKSRDGRSKSRGKGITCLKCGNKRHAKKDFWSKDKENQHPEKGKESNKEENISAEVIQDALILYLDNRIES